MTSSKAALLTMEDAVLVLALVRSIHGTAKKIKQAVRRVHPLVYDPNRDFLFLIHSARNPVAAVDHLLAELELQPPKTWRPAPTTEERTDE